MRRSWEWEPTRAAGRSEDFKFHGTIRSDELGIEMKVSQRAFLAILYSTRDLRISLGRGRKHYLFNAGIVIRA